MPLPPQHGYPLRLVVPGWYGMTSVKWLARISLRRRAVRRVPDAPLLPHPLRGGRAGRADHDHRAAVADGAAGDPRVHSRVPHARARAVRARRSCVVGRRRDRRASTSPPTAARRWSPAELGDASLGRWAWRSWRFSWDAEPGEHELCCRARDAAGDEQPLSPVEPRRLQEQRRPARARHRSRVARTTKPARGGLREVKRACARARSTTEPSVASRARRAPDSNRNRLASAALAVDHASRLGIPPSDAAITVVRRDARQTRCDRLGANGTRS